MKGIAMAKTTRHDVIEPNSLAAASTPAAKQRIHDNTDAAIASGIFGVPTILIDGELFWGNDDWPYLERDVAEEDVYDRNVLTAWDAVEVSATCVRR